MPTKRFAWKDRDTAALGLIQLAYHAPQYISQQALHILSAIRSDTIVSDLREISLDSERPYWERVYSLRALASVPGDIYFPELISIADMDLLKRQQIISQSEKDSDRLDELFIPNDMIGEIIAFAARHPGNRTWLFDCFDEADPLVVCILLSEQLSVYMPKEMSVVLLHRLIALLEAHPNVLTLYSVHQIYDYGDGDDKAREFLKGHFDTIVQKAISVSPSRLQHDELPWAIPFNWPELKAAIFQLRPDFEGKFLRDEARRASERSGFEENRREDLSYKDIAVWRELEALYERASNGDNQAYWKLYRKTYDHDLSITARAAAVYFFGKLRDYPGVIEKLAVLARRRCDDWEDYFSPVRFEAGKALFDIATPQAWEALVAAFFASPTNMLEDFLLDWIECLTDMLSGIATAYPGGGYGIENRWFKALSRESKP